MKITFIYPRALWLLVLVPVTAGLALLGPRRPTPRRFWGGLALRVGLLSLVILALAGIQLQLRADVLTSVFLLDVSDSVPADERARGENIIRQAIESMPVDDRAAVVLFGQDSLVERLASEESALAGLTSVPVTSRTDIAGALQLALALFPYEGAKRIVLLSDGRENLGYALDHAELAAAHQIELTYVPLEGPEGQVEVLMEKLEAPANLRQGQDFDLSVVVGSTAAVEATLRVFGDGQLIHSQTVTLRAGGNRFLIPVEAGETGFRRFHAQVVPESDTRLQNNEASAFTVIHGPPRVLVVEGEAGEASNLAQALEAVEMEVSVVLPDGMPTTLPELASYEVIILANVPASALPSGVMEALPVYVRELGKGLLMTGGENSFGAGGYLRSPLEDVLPVYMDVRAKEMAANLALVLAVDKSGSMGRCHCDDPDLRQEYTRQEVGQPKVDIAKEAVMRAAAALGPQDYLGVVAFDEDANWAFEISQLVDYATLEQSIGVIQASGQTNVWAGVEAAYRSLQETDAKRKHIILLTDGWTNSGDLTALVEKMEAEGITLSVVAAGGGSAEYLEQLTELGNGRYYPAVDILRVPDFFLKETIESVGEYIIEEAFYPLPGTVSPVMRGLDPLSLPALLGYNGTSPKNAARLDLVTHRGDPLMATWQHGLGRAAVWTSDVKGQWAQEWVAWEEFSRFAAQLVGWLLPAPQVEGISTGATLEDGRAVIRLEAVDEDGQARNFLEGQVVVVGPDLVSSEAALEQVGPGQYEASLAAAQPGTYLIRVGVNEGDRSLGQQTLGLVVPYSPEYKASGTDLALLNELAQVTGGGELTNPSDAFVHNLASTDYAREMWRPLLMVVAWLFPLDVALRRVLLGKEDIRKAGDWLRTRLVPNRERASGEPQILGNLFQARERARKRRTGEVIPPIHAKPDQPAEKATGESLPPPTPTAESSPDDTLTRLRDAKKRARKK